MIDHLIPGYSTARVGLIDTITYSDEGQPKADGARMASRAQQVNADNSSRWSWLDNRKRANTSGARHSRAHAWTAGQEGRGQAVSADPLRDDTDQQRCVPESGCWTETRSKTLQNKMTPWSSVLNYQEKQIHQISHRLWKRHVRTPVAREANASLKIRRSASWRAARCHACAFT